MNLLRKFRGAPSRSPVASPAALSSRFLVNADAKAFVPPEIVYSSAITINASLIVTFLL